MITPLVSLALLAQTSPVTLNFKVESTTGPTGRAEMRVATLPDQRRQVVLTMNLGIGAQAARVRQETIYAADGGADRKIQEVTMGEQSRRVVAELSAKGAKVTVRDGERTTNREVPLSEKAPRSNPATFWFDRTQPKVGDRTAAYTFDLDTLEWQLVTYQYVRATRVNIGGTEVPAHLIRGERAGVVFETEVDRGGLPLTIRAGTLRLVRDL